ncbi:alanine racemase [Craterilacuibacter sinensis]|uniref:Alanine racemase n=1 Tax=Craterilacuibacter sinensis TaxID=2686017 RepID=A0A845BNU2_9NEIS|nr:alanine racemase [Craterilacuibacter sinensis]MXR36848.1 alanine racemase [Craterilacuibacter sinensis]
MRPLQAEIRLDALRDNYRLARQLAGGRTLAVVKANAYGHGVVRCARALDGEADGFAVACIEEALELRAAGIVAPILLLEGVFEPDEYSLCAELGLWCVVQSDIQLAMLETSPVASLPSVWLKMDSGMHRAGFAPDDYAAAWQRLAGSGKALEIVKMSHFARADEPDQVMTQAQIETFDAACRALPGAASLANSAGLMVHPSARREWSRAGIMLYGVNPLPQGMGPALKPVMRLTSRIFAVREIAAGEPLGYGHNFVATRRTRVGLVACGYADGYPRLASTGSPVAIDGVRSRVIGRVSMDMLTVDLTDLPAAGLGSEVELWGGAINVNEVAACAGTIAYELLCNVKRARFV